MKEQAVLLKLTTEQWEQILRHEKTIHVDKRRPGEDPARVIVYAVEQEQLVGECLAYDYRERYSVNSLAAPSMTGVETLLEMADGGSVFAWRMTDPVEYENPIELSELRLERAPDDWEYVEVDALWPDL